MNDFKLNQLLQNKLTELGFNNPTQTQTKFLPITLKNRSLIGIAPTGTGKTLTYIIPIIEHLLTKKSIRAAIILPTNQLAEQVYSEFNKFKELDEQLKIVLMRRNEITYSKSQILIGTIETFKETIKRTNFDFVVLDELDMLIDDGFEDSILSYLAVQKIETLLAFSATHEPNTFKKLKLLKPQLQLVNLLKEFNVPPLIKNYLINTEFDTNNRLVELIEVTNPYLMLIFASKIETVEKIYNYVASNLESNYRVTYIHGGQNQSTRKNILQAIKRHEYQIIICSDILARGIDIEQVSHVINYDLPNNLDYFFHRIGRTGRNNASGVAITLATENNQSQIKRLEERKINFIKVKIKQGMLELTNSQKREKIKENIQSKYLIEGQKVALSKIKSKQIGKPGYKKKIQKIAKKEASKLKKQQFKAKRK